MVPAIAQSQPVTTRGDCSPIVADTRGNVTIYITCGLSKEEQKQNAVSALASAETLLRAVVDAGDAKQLANRSYLLNALDDYAETPTPAGWANLQTHATRSQKLLEAAITAAIAYNVAFQSSGNAILQGLHKAMYNRSKLLANLREAPLSANEARGWAIEYRKVLDQTANELSALRGQIKST